MTALAQRTGKLVVISGPAGVGKSLIVAELVPLIGAVRSVSATTRAPRVSEVDGREYCFVDRARFEEMIRKGELLEWAEVFGNLYGTPEAPVRRAIAEGRTIILTIDVQGGIQVYRKMPDATFVLIVPPSEQALEARLRGRGSEDEASLKRRLGKAKEEIAIATGSGVYRRQVVNDKLEQAVREVADIVTQESSRT